MAAAAIHGPVIAPIVTDKRQIREDASAISSFNKLAAGSVNFNNFATISCSYGAPVRFCSPCNLHVDVVWSSRAFPLSIWWISSILARACSICSKAWIYSSRRAGVQLMDRIWNDWITIPRADVHQSSLRERRQKLRRFSPLWSLPGPSFRHSNHGWLPPHPWQPGKVPGELLCKIVGRLDLCEVQKRHSLLFPSPSVQAPSSKFCTENHSVSLPNVHLIVLSSQYDWGI